MSTTEIDESFRKPLPKKQVMVSFSVVVSMSPGMRIMTFAPTVLGADPNETLVFMNSRTVVMTAPELLCAVVAKKLLTLKIRG